MARGAGSLFDTVLPVAHKYRVGAINWGLVAGKSQTYLPWDSWQHPYVDRAADDLVPRCISSGRDAVPATGGGNHP